MLALTGGCFDPAVLQPAEAADPATDGPPMGDGSGAASTATTGDEPSGPGATTGEDPSDPSATTGDDPVDPGETTGDEPTDSDATTGDGSAGGSTTDDPTSASTDGSTGGEQTSGDVATTGAEPTAGTGDPGDLVDFYVDAVEGDDTNDGSADAPLATITHAMSLAGSGDLVMVAPGIYDAAHGEVFPISIPPGVSLIGDPDHRGDGPIPTRIMGVGPVTGSYQAALVPGAGAEIRGFTLTGSTTVLHFGVFVNATVTLAENTYAASYGGVRLAGGNPLIESSTFETNSYGVYGCFGTGTITGNHFVTPSLNIDLQGTGPCTVTDNLIEGSGQVGLQNQGGSHIITGNTFQMPGGYTYGCISTSGSSLIRDNVCEVDQGNAVRVTGAGSPDLGTAEDPGGNVLGTDATVGIRTLGTGTISALGNSWPTAAPACGVQIVNESSATVVWGEGAMDFCD